MGRDNNNATPGNAAEAAAYWIVRLESPSCSPSDRAEFEAWRVASATHAVAYDRAQRALALVDRHLGSIELTELGEAVFEQTRPMPARRFGPLYGLAASFLLVIAFAAYLQFGDNRLAGSPKAVTVFETSVGERSTFSLSDGTTVTLNTNTQLHIQFDMASDIRQLELVRGQAHFDVEKDPRPFAVVAGDRRIVALGTAFEVWLEDDRAVRVTLVEGRVSVGSASDNGDPATPAPLTELSAGQQLTVGPDAPANVVQADLARTTAWRSGWLRFREDPLRDVVKEINRYSPQRLTLGIDPRLEQVRIGGSFRTGKTTTFLAAMESLHPVVARRVTPDEIILDYRQVD